jgi:hypothetical protein
MIIYHIMSGKQKRFVPYSHSSLSFRNGLTMTLYISVFLAHTSSTKQSSVRTSAMAEEHRDHHHDSVNSDQQDEQQQRLYSTVSSRGQAALPTTSLLMSASSNNSPNLISECL